MPDRVVPTLLQTHDSSEIAALLSRIYSAITRIASALCGNQKRGAAVVRIVMTRGMRQLQQWTDPSQAEAYFLHHTVLLCRRDARLPDLRDDVLLTRTSMRDRADYIAFIQAIRTLLPQQREAFILNVAQGLNIRWTGVAMDCSATAASTHLDVALRALRALAGPSYDALVQILIDVYRTLGPDESLSLPLVRKAWRNQRKWRMVKHAFAIVVCLVMISVAGMVIYWLTKVVEFG